ncbi:hypothetical protein HN652_06405 [archaeon]|nr:hypothetical protein [archaeon]
MVDSMFRETIGFFEVLGLYDVILPFLLVFTIVFAILEKTKILGTDKDGSTKKNINAIVAFVSAFLVIASTTLVSTINEVIANTVLILILIICFMLLVGAMHTGEKEFSLENFPAWMKFFMFLIFIGISVIFINALGWFEGLLTLLNQMDMEWVSSFVFLLIMFGFVWFIVRDPSPKKKD